MAKQLQYRVDVDTSKARSDIKNLNDDLKETEELTNVDLIIETAGAVRSVRELRTALRQIQDAQIAVGEGTEEYNKLAEAAANLKNQVAGVTEATNDLSGSASEQLSSSFGRLKEGIVNLDLDKVKQAFSQLRGSFIAFGNSIVGAIPGMRGLTGATRTFAAALAATGVGLIVIAIGSLIANFDKLKTAGGAIGATFSAIGKAFEFVKNGAIGIADALGLVDKAAINAGDSVDEVADAAAKLEKGIGALTGERKKLADEIESIQRQLRDDPVQDIIDDSTKEVKKLTSLYIDALEATGLFATSTISDLRTTSEETGRFVLVNLDGIRQSAEQNTQLTKAELSKVLTALEQAKIAELRLLEAGSELSKKLALQGELFEKQQIEKKLKAQQVADAKQGDLLQQQLKDREIALQREEELLQRSYDNQLQDIQLAVLKKESTIEDSLLKSLALEETFGDTFVAETKRIYDARIAIINESFSLGLISEAEYNTESEGLSLKYIDALASQQLRRLQNEKATLDELKALNNAASKDDLKSLTDRFAQADALAERANLLDELRVARSVERQGNLDIIKDEALLGIFEREFEQAQEKLSFLEQNGIREGALYEELVDKKIAAEIRLSQQVIALEEQVRQKRQAVLQASLQGASQFTGALDGLIQGVYANEIAAAEGNFHRQEELRKEAFAANKALQIVGAVMSTASAVINGLNAGLAMGGPWGIALGAITAAAAAATGAVQIATISATQYQPGTNPNTSVSAGAAGGLPSAAGANPNINFVGSGVGGSVVGGGAEMPFPLLIETQVSVSETELTSTQGLLSSYEQGAGLGPG